jgi:hypothetical protein
MGVKIFPDKFWAASGDVGCRYGWLIISPKTAITINGSSWRLCPAVVDLSWDLKRPQGPFFSLIGVEPKA